MKHIRLIIILIFVVFLEPKILFAGRIYVHPVLGIDGGNDGRNILFPIRTLSKAGYICHGGDTIFVRGRAEPYTGFHDTFWQVDTMGLIPVVIMPYFNESVILDGAGYNFQSWEAILSIEHSRNVIVKNFHVRNNSNGGAGIRVVSTDGPLFITKDVIVRNCLVHDTYRQGILVQAKNVTVDSCEIYNAVLRNQNGSAGSSGWEVALGTYLWPSTVDCWTNIVFINNIVHNSWGEGIVALRCYNFTIENNHVYDCYSAYIYIDNSRKGTIRKNWVHSTNDSYNRWYNQNFYAPGSGIVWGAEQNDYGVDSLISDLDIYNNLIVRTNTPISWWRDTANNRYNNSYKNINVYYNTMYLTYGYEGFYLDANTSGIYTPTNCNFKNNIICKGQYPLGTYRNYITTSSHYQHWQIDYNCFMHGNIPADIPLAHNIQGSPSFVDSTNINVDSNFRIRNNSNCRFAAIPVNTVSNDYWNAIRDNSLPCIGIHERQTLKINLTVIFEGLYDPSLNRMSRKDSIAVFLRDAISPYSARDSAKGIIDSISFLNLFAFSNAVSGTYFIVTKHFNCLETWSKPGGETFILNGTIYNYNLTTSSSQAYGNNLKLKGSKYCIYSGDVEIDGFIDISDLILIYNESILFSGGNYLPADLNADNFIDISDITICYNNSRNFVGVIRP